MRARLELLAVAATVAHFVVVLVYPRIAAALPRSRYLGFGVRVVYEDGRGILREILTQSTRLGFSIASAQTQEIEHEVRGRDAVSVTLEVLGQPSVEQLTLDLTDLDGVLEVTSTDLARRAD